VGGVAGDDGDESGTSGATGTLPVTGSPYLLRLLLLGAGLVAAGIALALSSRRGTVRDLTE
jgi:hypothetical protein